MSKERRCLSFHPILITHYVSLPNPWNRLQVLWGPTAGYDYKDDNFAGRINLGLDGEMLLPEVREQAEMLVLEIRQEVDKRLAEE